MVACGYTLLRIDDLFMRETVGMVALASIIVLVPWTIGAAYRCGKQRGMATGEMQGEVRALRRAATILGVPDHQPSRGAD